jgi:anti-sigma B factor antagonist
MAHKNEFSKLVVQKLPGAGIMVRFRARRLLLDNDIERAREELQSLIAPERLMLLDLTNVEYLSSGALGVLIGTQRALHKVAGNLSICGLRPDIEEVFRICRLEKLFEIYPDLETALGGNSQDAM